MIFFFFTSGYFDGKEMVYDFFDFLFDFFSFPNKK